MRKHEESKKNAFRDDVSNKCDFVRPRLDLIKSATGEEPNRKSLYNVGILYNNKISEILHYYYERDIDFFTDGLVAGLVHEYLENLTVDAINILDKYMEENVDAIDKYSRIKRSDNPRLKHYKELCDKVYEFDITKDLPMVLKEKLQSATQDKKIAIIYIAKFKATLYVLRKELESLNLEDSYYECEDILTSEAKKCAALINGKQKVRKYETYLVNSK